MRNEWFIVLLSTTKCLIQQNIAVMDTISEIINDHNALMYEEQNYQDIEVIRKLDSGMVQRNYLQIKQDIQEIIQSEMERLLNDPGRSHLVVRKV